jgi:hypothetical protein
LALFMQKVLNTISRVEAIKTTQSASISVSKTDSQLTKLSRNIETGAVVIAPITPPSTPLMMRPGASGSVLRKTMSKIIGAGSDADPAAAAAAAVNSAVGGGDAPSGAKEGKNGAKKQQQPPDSSSSSSSSTKLLNGKNSSLLLQALERVTLSSAAAAASLKPGEEEEGAREHENEANVAATAAAAGAAGGVMVEGNEDAPGILSSPNLSPFRRPSYLASLVPPLPEYDDSEYSEYHQPESDHTDTSLPPNLPVPVPMYPGGLDTSPLISCTGVQPGAFSIPSPMNSAVSRMLHQQVDEAKPHPNQPQRRHFPRTPPVPNAAAAGGGVTGGVDSNKSGDVSSKKSSDKRNNDEEEEGEESDEGDSGVGGVILLHNLRSDDSRDGSDDDADADGGGGSGGEGGEGGDVGTPDNESNIDAAPATTSTGGVGGVGVSPGLALSKSKTITSSKSLTSMEEEHNKEAAEHRRLEMVSPDSPPPSPVGTPASLRGRTESDESPRSRGRRCTH